MTRLDIKVLGVGVVGCLLIAGAGAGDRRTKLLFNTTASVPEGFYWVDHATPGVGDLAVVRAPRALAWWMAQRRYVLLNVPLLKEVAAVSGSQVCGAQGVVTIDGVVVGNALSTDRWGRRLRPFEGCTRLGKQDVFLFNGAAPSSLDSRYFGPLHRQDIIGRARPIWTWERQS